MILGVSRHTSSWTVLSETGRFPLTLRIFNNIIQFYFHLRNSTNNILNTALTTNIRLAKEGNNTWFRALERISKFLNLEQLLITSNREEIMNQLTKLKKTSTKLFIDEWQKERVELSGQSSKLGIFLVIKTSFSLSDYLMKSVYPSHRIALSKIRLSDHKFPIEVGRHDNIPREHRLCPFGCNQVGTESHYIFKCKQPFIREIIDEFLSKAEINECIDVTDEEISLTNLLKTNDTNIIKVFGCMNSRIQTIFKEITS